MTAISCSQLERYLRENRLWLIWSDPIGNDSCPSTEWSVLTTMKIRSIRTQHDRAVLFLARCKAKWSTQVDENEKRTEKEISVVIQRGLKKCEENAICMLAKVLRGAKSEKMGKVEKQSAILKQLEMYHNSRLNTENPRYVFSTSLWTMNPSLNAHAPIVLAPQSDQQKAAKKNKRMINKRKRMEQQKQAEKRRKKNTIEEISPLQDQQQHKTLSPLELQHHPPQPLRPQQPPPPPEQFQINFTFTPPGWKVKPPKQDQPTPLPSRSSSRSSSRSRCRSPSPVFSSFQNYNQKQLQEQSQPPPPQQQPEVLLPIQPAFWEQSYAAITQTLDFHEPNNTFCSAITFSEESILRNPYELIEDFF